MTQTPIYPKRPVRAAGLIFLGLSALFAISLAFQDGMPPQTWPWGFGYCALLPACVIGLLRLGPRVFVILHGLALLPIALGFTGVALPLRDGSSLDSGLVWFRVSLALFYALGVATGILSTIGWILY